MNPNTSPLLVMSGISKKFGDKVALENVDLSVGVGEVHAICGENGAGKSTLMNILSGIHQPDSGRILLRGEPIHFSDAAQATRMGIGMVHQHFTLVPSMTVAENIFLSRQPKRFGLLTDHKKMYAEAQTLIDKYGFRLDPGDHVKDLTVGQRQRVEIVKALAFDAEILILDEPTAVLTPREVDELIEVIAGLRDQGSTILFITHKLREVKALSDNVTVIRRGKTVATQPTASVTTEDLAREMVGRSVFMTERREQDETVDASREPVLRAQNLTLETAAGKRLLDDVSFEIRPGEVLGIAGVEGNGQTELAEVLTGLRKATSGNFTVKGEDATRLSPAELREGGVAHIPEDRLDRGLSRPLSVAENLAISNYASQGLLRNGLVNTKALIAWADSQIAEFDIRGAVNSTPVGDLSGGNMQKVVIARELSRKPDILVVAQPTRGVDIGASEFVHHQILETAANGAGVLLISSELSEIFALSDRIGVIFRGAIVDVIPRKEATEELVGLLMNTGSRESVA